MGAPVHDVSIVGLGMRDTAYTYMDFHSLPSGGDWSLERSAVVFVEGSERVTVEGCVFDRVDGNAILLSAYTRNASISWNEVGSGAGNAGLPALNRFRLAFDSLSICNHI